MLGSHRPFGVRALVELGFAAAFQAKSARVSKEVMAARSRSGRRQPRHGLTRFFAAAMARRSKEAIRRAEARPTKTVPVRRLEVPGLDVSVSFAVSPSEIVRAENDFRAAPTATDQMVGGRSVTAARPGCNPTPDFGLAEFGVFSRDAKAHVAGRGTNSLAHAPDTASDPREMADHRGLGETHEGIHQDRETRSPGQQS